MRYVFQVSFLNNNKNPKDGLRAGKSLLTPVFHGNKSEEVEGWRPERSHKVLRSSDFLASLCYNSAFSLIIYKLWNTKRPATGSIIRDYRGVSVSQMECGERGASGGLLSLLQHIPGKDLRKRV